MEQLNPPETLTMPFANNGTKNDIPVSPTGTNKASLVDGFPLITSTPSDQGGIPPARADFNGALNLNSQFYFAFQNGWLPTFNPSVSEAIGGYALNAILWYFDLDNNLVRPVRSLIGNNTYNFNTNKTYIGKYWAELVTDGQGLPVGAVYFSQSPNKTDNVGALPLFTGETIEEFSLNYPVFYNFISNHPELCKTNSQYQTALSTYGECPFYVWDSAANTLRLPILKNYIKAANATDGIKAIEAGLPNIVGQAQPWPSQTNSLATGPFTITPSRGDGGLEDWTTQRTLNFDASLSSAVYGKSNTVTPASTTLYPWVVAYHAEQPDSTQQVEEIIQAGQEQLSNIQTQGAQIIAQAQAYAQAAAESASRARGFVMGTVYFSQFSSATQNPGALPLFTGETITSADTIYPDFYAAILADTGLQCTSTEYEEALETYGECAKYVLDNGAMRLPLIKNYIKAANLADGIKNISAGLPNIVGQGKWIHSAGQNEYTGPFYVNKFDGGDYSKNQNVTNNGGEDYSPVHFDASLSSAVYGKSNTVTPASTTLYPWVVAFNAAVPASFVQVAQFQKALATKADKN